jgi:hypothetical protein
MTLRGNWATDAVTVGLAALVAALFLERFAPPPSADVSRGSEEAFVAEGLHERERAPDRTPFRWTEERATARFRRLTPGPALVEVGAVGHRGPVQVEVGGAVVGTLTPPVHSGSYETTIRSGGALDVALVAQTFEAGGRTLGTQWRYVRVVTAAGFRFPGWSLLALLGLPALLSWAAARLGGLPRWASVAGGMATAAAGTLLLLPFGLVHSPYAWTLAGWLSTAGLLAGAAARVLRARGGGALAWVSAAAWCAVMVQGTLATSPVMVTSDSTMQAHKLDELMGGELFLTSVTQHERPFIFPYGIALFAAVAPLRAAGLDPVTLVRWGAGLAGILASLGLLLGLTAVPRRTLAQGVLLLQFLPGTFLIYSQGNLPNAFGQAATTLFFVWWVGRPRGGWPLGGLLLAVAGLSHLSCVLILGPLSLGLWLAWRRQPRPERRKREWALVSGWVAAGLYYAHFVPLMLGQVKRLTEGGGQGAAEPWSHVLKRQLDGALFDWWGIPVLVLVLLGLYGWVRRRDDSWADLRRGLAAYWVAAGVFFLPALVSPLEVRYLYALTIPVALTAAGAWDRLAARGRPWAAVAGLLALAQMAQGTALVVERLLWHYRQPT